MQLKICKLPPIIEIQCFGQSLTMQINNLLILSLMNVCIDPVSTKALTSTPPT